MVDINKLMDDAFPMGNADQEVSDTDNEESVDDGTEEAQETSDTGDAAGPNVSEPVEDKSSVQEPTKEPARQESINATEITGRVTSDKQGNLVDSTGRVVAKSGNERRLWEKAERFKQQLAAQSSYIETAKAEAARAIATVKEAENLHALPKELGLSTQEVAVGYQLMSQFKSSPMDVLRILLTEAQAKGYDISEFTGQSSSIQTAAINRMMEEKLNPVVNHFQAQQQELATQRQAQQALDTFITEHPYSMVHEQVIMDLMSKDNRLDPHSAYVLLRNHITQNGLDITRPLQEQLAERAQAQQNQQVQRQVPPMTGGSVNSGNVSTKKPAMDYSNNDYSAIIKQAIISNGVKR